MYLIANGKVITRDDAMPYIENGGVVVEGFRLVAQEERGLFAGCYDDLADRRVERDALAIDE